MASICLRDDLVDRCLENLAVLHDIPLKELKDQYLDLVKVRRRWEEKGMGGSLSKTSVFAQHPLWELEDLN
jgi:hypothetical protein